MNPTQKISAIAAGLVIAAGTFVLTAYHHQLHVYAAAAPATDAAPVKPISGKFCQALVPDGWRITDQDAYGTTFSVASPDNAMKASYGSFGITTAMQSGAAMTAEARAIACREGLPACNQLNNVTPQQQGAQYGSATSSVEYVLTQALRTNLKFDAAPKTVQFNYQLLNFTAPGMRGFVLYRVYNSAQGSAYIMRLAVGSAVPTDHTLAVAGTVATSISCRQQLRPPPPPQPTTYQSGAKPADTASSTKCQIWSPNCDDSDFAGSYNAQLGTGYVHSNSCTNYVVDPDTDKWENGPDGPGYYIDVGNNNVEKLQPGRCDD